jgi:ribose transport system substrate-binding protein
MIGKRLLAAGLVAAVVVGACGSGAASPTAAPASQAATPAATQAASSAASSSTAAAKVPYKVVGVYANGTDEYWATFACGARARAKVLGLDYKEFTTPSWDASSFSTAVDTAMLTNPQAATINPIEQAPLATRVKQIMDSGVPVVTSGFLQPNTQLLVVQPQQTGASAAYSQNVVDAIKAAGNGTGEAVIVEGVLSASWEHDRYDGIINAVKAAYPGLKWLDSVITGFDVAKGTTAVSALIAAHPNLKFIIAPTGPDGAATAAAVKESGASGKITVVAFDAVPAEVAALKDGTISFLIAQPAAANGAEEVQALVDWLNSNPNHSGPIASTTNSRVLQWGFLTKDNVDDPANAGFVYSATCN